MQGDQEGEFSGWFDSGVVEDTASQDSRNSPLVCTGLTWQAPELMRLWALSQICCFHRSGWGLCSLPNAKVEIMPLNVMLWG